jgi:hypothetical protein
MDGLRVLFGAACAAGTAACAARAATTTTGGAVLSGRPLRWAYRLTGVAFLAVAVHQIQLAVS